MRNMRDLWGRQVNQMDLGGLTRRRRDVSLIFAPNVLSAGTWVNGNTVGYSTAGASSTAYSEDWYTDISAGTWTIEFLTLKSNNGAIVTFEYSLDGGTTWVTIAANVDHYAAAQAYLQTSLAGVVITRASEIILRIRSTGTKNASSAGYYILGVAANLRRTA